MENVCSRCNGNGFVNEAVDLTDCNLVNCRQCNGNGIVVMNKFKVKYKDFSGLGFRTLQGAFTKAEAKAKEKELQGRGYSVKVVKSKSQK